MTDPRNQASQPSQIVAGKNSADLVSLPERFPDTLAWWMEQYFRFEVTTSMASQKIQWRDLGLFNDFVLREEKTSHRLVWEELRAALQARVTDSQHPGIPVIPPGVASFDGIPAFLRRLSWIDLRQGDAGGEGVGTLISAVREVVASGVARCRNSRRLHQRPTDFLSDIYEQLSIHGAPRV